MRNATEKMSWGPLLAIGSAWGLSEVAMGMFLRGMCARFITGSVMTGVAVFFLAMAMGWQKRKTGLLLLLGLASVFKLFDAYLLHLPVLHGAVANPIFAFYTEVFAFLLVWMILDSRLKGKTHGRALHGGLAALVALNLFPLVKFATGIPACVYPGTNYPLALYYAPIAIGLSAVTCPLGMVVGRRLAAVFQKTRLRQPEPRLVPALLNLSPVLTLLLMLVLRWA